MPFPALRHLDSAGNFPRGSDENRILESLIGDARVHPICRQELSFLRIIDTHNLTDFTLYSVDCVRRDLPKAEFQDLFSPAAVVETLKFTSQLEYLTLSW